MSDKVKIGFNSATCDFDNGCDKNDMVHHPKHYEILPNVESVDIIEAIVNRDKDLLTPFASWCLGNILKYLFRAGQKNGLEDYQKAQVYLNWLIEEIDGNQPD